MFTNFLLKMTFLFESDLIIAVRFEKYLRIKDLCINKIYSMSPVYLNPIIKRQRSKRSSFETFNFRQSD